MTDAPLHMLPYDLLWQMARELIRERIVLKNDLAHEEDKLEDYFYDDDYEAYHDALVIVDSLEWKLHQLTERLVAIQEELRGTPGYVEMRWDIWPE